MDRNTTSARYSARALQWGLPLALAVITVPAASSEWRLSADLFTGLTYTDNVALAPNGLRQDEGIWEISPTFIATRDGKSTDIQFEYRLQGLLYAREDRRNEVYNFLRTNLQTELLPDLLRFDADASISQTVIDPLIANNNSSISTNGNIAETMTVNASPYILRQLGPNSLFRAGASASLVMYDDDVLIDNTQRDTFASFTNNGGGGPINWSVNYNSKLVDYDVDPGSQEIELARISGEIGIRLGPRTDFVMSGGEDINDFADLPGSRVAEGTFWNVGFRGGLGRSITFDVRAGEQFFGDSYSVQFSRNTRGINTTLSYQESATTVGAQQLDFSNALSLLGLAGNLTNQFDVNGLELPQRDPELYIRRRFDFANTINLRRTTMRASVYYEDREFIRSVFAGARENVEGARLEWTWTLGAATSLNSTATYQKLRSRDNISEPRDLRVSVNLRQQIFQNSYIDWRIWRNTRRAPQANTQFEENALRIGIGRRF